MDICEKLVCHSCEEGKCSEKRRTVVVTNNYGREIATLYNALPSCEHEIVDGDNWSGIKCKKCGGWYCA